jgi:ArsR family transcriptional regulator, arsenate/arsenite/antimonite-responsive transcriptional repressor
MFVDILAHGAGYAGRTMDVKPISACCEPLLDAPLSDAEAEDLAAAFKVLADPARLRLFSLIASASAGEACACDLVEPLGKSQPTVSHHLSVLTDAGLVTRDKRGRWAWYRANPERLEVLRDVLGSALAA